MAYDTPDRPGTEDQKKDKWFRNYMCRYFGHGSDNIILRFDKVTGQAVVRCPRCSTDILIDYYASVPLANKVNGVIEEKRGCS